MKAKFKLKQRVHHPEGPPESFPEGDGQIAEVTVSGTYKVQSEKTGKILPIEFKEEDLREI